MPVGSVQVPPARLAVVSALRCVYHLKSPWGDGNPSHRGLVVAVLFFCAVNGLGPEGVGDRLSGSPYLTAGRENTW